MARSMILIVTKYGCFVANAPFYVWLYLKFDGALRDNAPYN